MTISQWLEALDELRRLTIAQKLAAWSIGALICLLIDVARRRDGS